MKKIGKMFSTVIMVGLFLYVFNFEYCEYLISLTCDAALECVTGGSEYSNKLMWEMDNLKVSNFVSLKVNGQDVDLDNTDFGQNFYDDIVDKLTNGEGSDLRPELLPYVKDKFEGTGETLQNNFNQYLRENVWCRTDLSNQDKIDITRANFAVLTPEQKTDFNVVGDVRALKEIDYSDWGEYADVNWPSFPGLDKTKEVYGVTADNLSSSLDRIGYVGGQNFGIMPSNGYKYTPDERAIPYIENEYAYNQYELDTENYFEAIDCIKNNDCEGLNSLIDSMNEEKGMEIKHISESDMKEYNEKYEKFQSDADLIKLCEEKKIDSTYGVFGEAAPFFTVDDQLIYKGGAQQLNIPVSGKVLKDLGILMER